MTIVLVEDNPQVQYFICKLLEVDGFTVLTAGDGEAALDMSRNHTGQIDLLLSDVRMRRMNGAEPCQKLSAERPEIKVVMMSGDLTSR